MSGPKVTDAGLVALARLPGLRSLTLHTRKVTGAGLAHLHGLAELRHLSLHGLRIEDGDLMQLANLAHLRTLNLSVRGVTWDGVGRIQKALPQLSVGYSYAGR